jgi:hypothetical protein
VRAPPDYNSDQLTFCVFLICSLKNQSFLRRIVHQPFKSNVTFSVVCVFNLQFEKSVFLKRMVHSQLTLQRQLRRQIKKKTPLCTYVITDIRTYLLISGEKVQ